MPAPAVPSTSATIKPEDLSQDAVKDLIMYKARPEMAQGLDIKSFNAHMQSYAECQNLQKAGFEKLLTDIGKHMKYSTIRRDVLAMEEVDVEERKNQINQKLHERGVIVTK